MGLFDQNHIMAVGNVGPNDLTVYQGTTKMRAVWYNGHIIWPFPNTSTKRIQYTAGAMSLPDSYAYCFFLLGGGGGGGGGGTGGKGEGGRAGVLTSRVLVRGVTADDYILAQTLYAVIGSAGVGNDSYNPGTAGGSSQIRLGSSSGSVVATAAGGAGGASNSTSSNPQNGGSPGSYTDPDFLVTMTANGGGTGNGGNATLKGCGGAGGNQQFLGNNKGGNGAVGEIDLFYL